MGHGQQTADLIDLSRRRQRSVNREDCPIRPLRWRIHRANFRIRRVR